MYTTQTGSSFIYFPLRVYRSTRFNADQGRTKKYHPGINRHGNKSGKIFFGGLTGLALTDSGYREQALYSSTLTWLCSFCLHVWYGVL